MTVPTLSALFPQGAGCLSNSSRARPRGHGHRATRREHAPLNLPAPLPGSKLVIPQQVSPQSPTAPARGRGGVDNSPGEQRLNNNAGSVSKQSVAKLTGTSESGHSRTWGRDFASRVAAAHGCLSPVGQPGPASAATVGTQRVGLTTPDISLVE
jgi:hypothetical protein